MARLLLLLACLTAGVAIADESTTEAERRLDHDDARVILQTHLTTFTASRRRLQERYSQDAVTQRLAAAFTAAGMPENSAPIVHHGTWAGFIVLDHTAAIDRFHAPHVRILDQALSGTLRWNRTLDLEAFDPDLLASRMERLPEVEARMVELMEARVATQIESGRQVWARQQLQRALSAMSTADREARPGEVRRLEAEIARLDAANDTVRDRAGALQRSLREDVASLRLFDRFERTEALKAYRIARVAVDTSLWRAERDRRAEAVADAEAKLASVRERASAQLATLSGLRGELQTAREHYQRAAGALRIAAQALQGAPDVPAELESDMRRRTLLLREIERLESAILAAEEEASGLDAAGERVAARALRDVNGARLETLAEAEASRARLDARLRDYDAAWQAALGDRREVLIAAQVAHRDAHRRRELALDRVRAARSEAEALAIEREAALSARNQAVDALAELAIAGRPRVETVTVQADGKMVYSAFRDVDPRLQIAALDEPILLAEDVLERTREDFIAARTAFELRFEDSRAALANLHGLFGAIMFSAYRQALAESAVLLLEVAEAARKGGYAGALADASYKLFDLYTFKGGQAFATADENAVLRDLFPAGHPFRTIPDPDEAVPNLRDHLFWERAAVETGERTIRDLLLEPAWQRVLLELVSDPTGSGVISEATRKLLFGANLIGAQSSALRNGRELLSRAVEGKGRPASVADVSSLGGNLVWGALKTAANDGLKRHALSIEEEAWADYFRADAIAQTAHLYMVRARSLWWQAQDHHAQLLELRRRLVAQAVAYDPDMQLRVTAQAPFDEGALLRVWIASAEQEGIAGAVQIDELAATEVGGGVSILRARGLPDERSHQLVITVTPRIPSAP